MTDRIPLIVNSVDSQIQELPSADNLNLANSNIVGVIGITASGNLEVDAVLTDNYYYANGSPFVSGISLSDISVTSASPSGNGSLSYDNTTGVFTFAPSAPQALTWDVGTSNLSLTNGNSVDLSSLEQTISLSSNTITISGSNSTVDLTSALGNVAGNYGDANVEALGEAGWTGNIIPASNEVYDLGSSTNRWEDIYLSGSTIDLGGTTVSVAGGTLAINSANLATVTELTTANTEMQAYVDALETRIVGGANGNLDSLAEVANALANSNTELSTVAFTGTYGDLQSRPTLTLANSDLTYDGTTVDLSGVGAQGPQGNTGPQGNAGVDGVGVSNATINGSGNLVLTLSDSSTIDAGDATGPQGNAGVDGVGITSVSLVGGNLQLTYSNTSTQDVGNIQGPAGSNGVDGAAGNDGVSVSSASVNGSGNLIITLTDASTVDAGNVRGADGSVDQTLSLAGNVITISGSGSNVDLTTALGSVTSDYGDSNVASFLSSNSYSNVAYGNTEVQAYLDAQGYSNVDSDAQTLSISGNVITISGSNSNVDLTTALGNVGGGGGGSSSFDIAGNSGTHTFDGSSETLTFLGTTGEMNVSVATNTLSFEFANTGVTAGTYGSTTQAPRITVDAKGRVTSITNQTISGGGGGGGTSYEYFKLNYTSAGAIDTSVGTDGISNISTNIGNVTVNNSASNSCEIVVDFGGNYNFPPVGIVAYGFAQSTSEYNIKHMTQNTVNTTLKLDGSSAPHGNLGSANVTMSLTRAETGASSGFGQTSHAWIYFVMGS